MLALLVAMNLLACGAAENTNAYKFEYKFKEEYSEIDSVIASIFLNLVNGLIKIHSTALDIENLEVDNELNSFISEHLDPLRDDVIKSPNNYTEKELEVLKHMMKIAATAGNIKLVKLEYASDKANEKMGLKRKNTEEYYTEQLAKLKVEAEKLLEESKNFIE